MSEKVRLTDIPLFQFLRPEHVPLLNECAVPLQKKAQDAIILEGEGVLGIYVVVQGQVQVHSGIPHQPITYIQRGEAFGEMSMIENTHASATIRAASADTKLVFIHGERFREKLATHADLATAFYRGVATVLSKRLRITTRQASHQIMKNHQLSATLMQASSAHPLSTQCQAIRDKLGALSSFIANNAASEDMIQNCQRQIRDVEAAAERLEKLSQTLEGYLFTL